jgi:hypothetical protein
VNVGRGLFGTPLSELQEQGRRGLERRCEVLCVCYDDDHRSEADEIKCLLPHELSEDRGNLRWTLSTFGRKQQGTSTAEVKGRVLRISAAVIVGLLGLRVLSPLSHAAVFGGKYHTNTLDVLT